MSGTTRRRPFLIGTVAEAVVSAARRPAFVTLSHELALFSSWVLP